MRLWQTDVRWICSFALLNFKWNYNNTRGVKRKFTTLIVNGLVKLDMFGGRRNGSEGLS
ncbi:MAG: hypothetical protein ACTS4T_01300 [Candidatus Hodgkinia cicadicola]